MKVVKDILETIALVILICIAAIGAFVLFAGFYYWYLLIFEPWFYDVCCPWIVEQIKIIFSNPENFCGFLFILWAFICLLVTAGMLIGAFVSWVKKSIFLKT